MMDTCPVLELSQTAQRLFSFDVSMTWFFLGRAFSRLFAADSPLASTARGVMLVGVPEAAR